MFYPSRFNISTFTFCPNLCKIDQQKMRCIMKILKILQLVFLLVLLPLLIKAQTTQFNINEYKQFLQSHQNMVTSELLELHPAGVFKANLNVDYQAAQYFDSISIKYNLTDFEKSLIKSNGFMVSERLSRNTFGEAFLEIYQKDLPVFISTDAILHAFHRSYDRILKDVEIGFIISNLTSLLQVMHSNINVLHSNYGSNPEMLRMLQDVDIYFTVARKLLGISVNPFYTQNNIEIDTILSYINSETMKDAFLFSSNCKRIDFSQFKPRGHYIDEHNPQLEKYFRTMMWLGRIEIYLSRPSIAPFFPCLSQTDGDIQRQIIDAVLISELYEISNASSYYENIESILRFFVGNSDNVTLENVQWLKQRINLPNASALLDSNICKTFQDTLKNQTFANQLILSQILMGGDPLEPDSIVPASAFLLFGQRFVIDSYVTASVVYDRIFFNGGKVCRLFPSTLDPMFALGNDAAAQLLKPELDQFNYSSNLAALRYLINSYGTDFWDSTIYNMWLNVIRNLNPPLNRESLPLFMQTAAFWQEKLNTQLASWTQLRHDNLLYAKQSYSGGTVCSYPYAYLEPFPEFYTGLKHLANVAIDKFQNLNFSDVYFKIKVMEYFNSLKEIMDTLGTISQKELDNIPLTLVEDLYLKSLIYNQDIGSGTPPFGGWYARLFFDDPMGQDGLLKKDQIVADIHTIPTNCGGGFVGWVKHVGIGPINLGVFITQNPDNQNIAYIGPFLSYYDYTTTNFLRLTDQEWESTYLKSALRPDWVNIYLADSSGNSKGSGQSLITFISNENNSVDVPSDFVTVGNYPNPFNPATIIWFKIPSNLTNSFTELAIYDVNGALINILVYDVLPSGNYLVKWNGQNAKGKDVSSGVYFYHLKVADKLTTGKMVLMR